MANHTEDLIAIINGLPSLNGQDRDRLLAEAKKLEKKFVKDEFKISRILKDKDIAINVLNTTIKELEAANEEALKNKEELREQKEIIEEKSRHLAENLRKLEQSYREMEQFAYIASHDLKSPLRTISNFAQLLKRRYLGKLDAEADDFINYIISGTVQMHEVICDSLEYAQADKNKERFTMTNMEDVMRMVLLNLKEEIEKSGASIFYHDLPMLKGNKTSLVQLFQNLIGNAIKFRSELPPQINIEWEIREDGFQFKVSDNGIGISKEYHEKIFLPFQRLNRDKLPGSGIGLAICKKIVDMHGGEITCQSRLGEGTAFIFTVYPQEVELPAPGSIVRSIDSQRA